MRARGASGATGYLLSPHVRGGKGRGRCEFFASYLTPPPLYQRSNSRKRDGIDEETGDMMVAAVALSLLVASGIALAVNKVGTQGRDFLKGTDGADHLVGKGEDDRIFSLAGKDTLIGGPGKDFIWAGGIRSSHQDPKVTYTNAGGEKKMVGGPDKDAV